MIRSSLRRRQVSALSPFPVIRSSLRPRQVLRVAELQAEDYHLDRPLFFACREDRERFCASVVSGNGKVYQCLLQHKMEKEMSRKVRHTRSFDSAAARL